MNSDKEPPESAIQVLHETALGVYDAGVIDKQTMRKEEIRDIRERQHVSQAVFARHLNVTKSLVSQWELGEKRPFGPSLKLLSLVEKNGLAAIM